MPSLHRWRRLSGGGGDAGGMAGSRAAWRSYTPPLMVYVGTISGFSLQKFFFGFRVALGRCRLAKLLAYIVECVQIDKEWDGKLFVLSYGFKGLKGSSGLRGKNFLY